MAASTKLTPRARAGGWLVVPALLVLASVPACDGSEGASAKPDASQVVATTTTNQEPRPAPGTDPSERPSGDANATTTPGEKPAAKPDAKPDATPDGKPDNKQDATPVASLPTMTLTLGGREYTLELALNDKTRFKGLSGRTEIPEDRGLMFVFRREQSLQFVMRDCPAPIDIIYVDKSGRITAMHNMEVEPPRKDDEKTNRAAFPGAPEWSWTNEKYEARLRKYPSRFGAIIAIELRGGTLDLGDGKQIEGAPEERIKLKVGDKIDGLDVPALVKRAE